MDAGVVLQLLGPTLAVAVTAAGSAILMSHGHSIRIEMLEKSITDDRTANAKAISEVKALVIESEKRILQALRDSDKKRGP